MPSTTWNVAPPFIILFAAYYFFLYWDCWLYVGVCQDKLYNSRYIYTAVCYNFNKTYIMSAVIEQDSN